MGIKNVVDVRCSFAQFDASDGGSLRLLLGDTVRSDCSFHCVNKLLLFRVPRRTRSTAVCIYDLL